MKYTGVVGLAGMGFAGKTTATKSVTEDNTPGTDEIRITDTVHGYMIRGEVQKARDLLRKHNVKHSINTKQVNPQGEQTNIGTRTAYSSNDSSVSIGSTTVAVIFTGPTVKPI